jgi:hypothetical protein
MPRSHTVTSSIRRGLRSVTPGDPLLEVPATQVPTHKGASGSVVAGFAMFSCRHLSPGAQQPRLDAIPMSGQQGLPAALPQSAGTRVQE